MALKVTNRNTITRCEICSKLTIKTTERCYWRRSGVFIVNFEHISHLVLVFLMLTLNMYWLQSFGKHFAIMCEINFRGSLPLVLYQKVILKNFAKFTEKPLRWSLLLIKLRVYILVHSCFAVYFVNFFSLMLNISGQLLQ